MFTNNRHLLEISPFWVNAYIILVCPWAMYSPELISRAKEFWFIFDNRYIPIPTAPHYNEVMQLYLNSYLFKPNPTIGGGPIPNLDWMFLKLKENIRADPLNYEQLFLTEVSRYGNGIKALAADQAGIINEYSGDVREIQEAFELFGQGVLYDKRRGNVHQMQGSFPQSMVGYSRWHGFAKAAISVGEDYDFWLNLDRCLLLAYMIQAELRPLDTKRDNPISSEERLREYLVVPLRRRVGMAFVFPQIL
jgi:hypothetical protein